MEGGERPVSSLQAAWVSHLALPSTSRRPSLAKPSLGSVLGTHKELNIPSRDAGQTDCGLWVSMSLLTSESHLDFPRGASSKEPACQCRRCKKRRFDP